MDLWMLHESRSADLERSLREQRIRCALTDGRCWRRRIALRSGLLLFRLGRRLIAYGRPQGAPPATASRPS